MNNLLKIGALLIIVLLWACNTNEDTDEPNNTFRLDEYQSNWQKRKIDNRPLSNLPGALSGMFADVETGILLQNGDSVYIFVNRKLSSPSSSIFSSFDKGQTWQPYSSINGLFIDLCPIGSDTVYALRDYLGDIEFGKSFNAGQNWEWSSIPSNPTEISFYDSNTGLAFSLDGVYMTQSGSAPWTKVSNDVLKSALAVNDSTFIAIQGKDIKKTMNCGNSWVTVHTAGFDLVNIFLSSKNILYAGGYSASVFRSFDLGNNWSQIFQLGQLYTGVQNARLNSFCMIDSLNGFAAVSFDSYTDMGAHYDQSTGLILRTADAGETWVVNYFSEIINFTSGIAVSGPVIMFFGRQKEDNIWSGIYSTRTQTLGN